MHNSLPAALELATYFSGGKLNVPMIFSENELKPTNMEVFYRMQHTVRKLKKSHLALIGGPSPWLLSNPVNHDVCIWNKRWMIFILNGMENHVLLVNGMHQKAFTDWNQYMIYRR